MSLCGYRDKNNGNLILNLHEDFVKTDFKDNLNDEISIIFGMLNKDKVNQLIHFFFQTSYST
jgi:hypothetical protein